MLWTTWSSFPRQASAKMNVVKVQNVNAAAERQMADQLSRSTVKMGEHSSREHAVDGVRGGKFE